MTYKEFRIQYALGTIDLYKINNIEENIKDKKILSFLSKNKNYSIRCRVARNPNTPVSILKVLIKDDDPYVRMWVLQNINCPKNIDKYR
jgi:hypothetical protein